MENKPKIMFIIGMHRSGTSLLSNCLIQNGFSIGITKNQDKDWQNPKGYFENDAFTEMHENLLTYNGCSWHTIIKEKMKYTRQHIENYRTLIKKEFSDNQLILIKDPRLTFFIDFLKEVCEDKYEYYFLFLTRNKKECCTSLSKAQNKSYDEISKLYDRTMYEYNESFLKIIHSDIINNNKDTLERISNYCNFSLINSTEDIVDYNLYRCRNI